MTHTELKKIVDSGDYCIQCPTDYATNEKWNKFAEYHVMSDVISGVYYSRCKPEIGGLISVANPNFFSITVLTLDEWWSVVHGEKFYTIKDLADGKVACVNDGTVEELNKVWVSTLGRPCKFEGISKFYWMEDGLGINHDTNLKNLPTQSVKDFVKQLESPKMNMQEYEQHLGDKFMPYSTAWQPLPGEVCEFCKNSEFNNQVAPIEEGKYIGRLHDTYVYWNGLDFDSALFCRPIKQYHTTTIEELKAAYAQVHGVDVERIKVKEVGND